MSATATPITTTPAETESDEQETSVLLTLHDLTPLRQLETTRREFVANVSHELRNPWRLSKRWSKRSKAAQ